MNGRGRKRTAKDELFGEETRGISTHSGHRDAQVIPSVRKTEHGSFPRPSGSSG